MGWNLFLAFIAYFFAYFALKLSNKTVGIILFILAVLFSPNTIYMTTDSIHLLEQWKKISTLLRPLLIIEYFILIVLGIISFFLTVKLLEHFLNESLHKKITDTSIFLLNYLIAFGVVIGRIQRANSWHVFTKPQFVFNNIIKTLSSPELIFYILTFGLFANLIYFALKGKYSVGERT